MNLELDRPYWARPGAGVAHSLQLRLRHQKTFDDALRAVGADPGESTSGKLEARGHEGGGGAEAGIAAVSALVAAPAIADGSVRGFRVEGLKMKRKFYMIHHKRKVLSPAAEAFRQHIIDTLVEKVVNN